LSAADYVEGKVRDRLPSTCSAPKSPKTAKRQNKSEECGVFLAVDLRSFFLPSFTSIPPSFHHQKPLHCTTFPRKPFQNGPLQGSKKMSSTTGRITEGLMAPRQPCDNSLKDHRPKRIRIQPPIESSVRPPKMRTSYPSPALVFVIVGVIVAAFAMFLVFTPH